MQTIPIRILMSRAFLLFLLFVFFSFSGYTQDTTSYSIKHYSDDNGLPQNSVKSIVRDESGFLWLATEGGLVRFDGNTFFLYDKQATGTRSNRIYTITKVSKNGKLYAENEYAEFISIINGHALAKPLSYGNLFNGKDTLKILDELPIKRINSGKFIIQPTNEEKYSILTDSVFFSKGNKITRVPFKHKKHDSFFSMATDLVYSDNKETFTLFRHGLPISVKIKGDLLWDNRFKKQEFKIYWNNNTDQAFLYLHKALYQLEYNGTVLTTKRIINGFDFEGKQITTIYFDAIHKRLFLGSTTQGLFVLQHRLFNTKQQQEHIANTTTYAQLPFRDNIILFANGDLLSTAGKVNQLPLLSLYSNNYSLVIDKQKNIWTQNESSVYQFSSTGDRLLRTFNFPDEASCLYMDQDSTLWIGTRGSIYTYSSSEQNALPKPVVRIKDVSYLQRKNNILWIGTFKGLYQYDLEKETISAIPQLAKTHIRSIYIRNEETWISTFGDGFFLYKNHRLLKMPLDDQKYLNHTHCLIEDKRGFFWISTNKGLFQVAIKDLLAFSENTLHSVYYAYFDRTLGFRTNEFNGGCQPCGSALNDGFFVFPSLVGSVLFNPSMIPTELPDKSIFIDKILVDNTNIYKSDTLNLSQDFERMEISVSSPYFGNQKNLQFEYRLSNNGSWQKPTERIITFSKLQHGSYALYIRKLNGFGSTFTIRKMTIIVRPYFYQTWWFYSILAVLTVAGLILYIKKRTQLIVLKNERLENLIKKRTEDLEKNIINLEESQYLLNQQTSFQKKLLAAITHDLKSPLKYMMIMGKQLYKKEVAGSPVKDSMMAIYISANSMYHLTENLLNYSKLFHTEKPSKDDDINLNLLVAEKIGVFSEIAKYNHTAIHNNIPSNLILHTNRVMLAVIIHNLLDNAIKFCPGGRIEFDAKSTAEKVTLWVQDTGCGIPADILNWLNADESAAANQELTDGLGLKMVKEFAAKMTLQLEVESEIGWGTKIKLSLMQVS